MGPPKIAFGGEVGGQQGCGKQDKKSETLHDDPLEISQRLLPQRVCQNRSSHAAE
jgi:hypothetical protein